MELYVKILRIFGEKHEAYSLWDAFTCRETISANTYLLTYSMEQSPS